MAVTVFALIVAAGRGARAVSQARKPKQYCTIGGVPVLTHTLSAFAGHGAVDGIQVVIHPDDVSQYRDASASFADRLLGEVFGGPKRQESVRRGLEALVDRHPDFVLIHDAARPFVDGALISRVIDALETKTHVGALPCLPVTDTLKRESGGRITGTVSRDGLCRAQTPQGFQFDPILAAHRAAARDSTLDFTDDAAVAEWFGLDVTMVEGSEKNRKLTTAEDLIIADRQLRQDATGTVRVGSGYDVHAFGPGSAVTLCGVHIAHTKGLVGHSDADVGLHALTDALLGAIGDGDIGTHFPPSDDRWRGVASHVFLKDAGDRINARGGTILNVDVTLLCEAPRIGPHREAMRQKMAEILAIDPGRVSVKATTNERLGFIGREEGIAALASASVLLP